MGGVKVVAGNKYCIILTSIFLCLKKAPCIIYCCGWSFTSSGSHCFRTGLSPFQKLLLLNSAILYSLLAIITIISILSFPPFFTRRNIQRMPYFLLLELLWLHFYG